MEDKIINALKTKYANLGLSDKALQGVAKIIASTIKEESEIDGAVNSSEGYLKLFQSEADRIRTEAKKPEPPKQEQEKKPEPPKPDENPELTLLRETVQKLTGTVEGLTREKTSTSRKENLSKVLNETKVPKTIADLTLKQFEKMQFGTDEDFTSYLEETKTSLTEIAQNQQIEGLQNQPFSAKTPKSGEKATDKELDAVMSKI